MVCTWEQGYGCPQGIRGTAVSTCHNPPEMVHAGEKSVENPLSFLHPKIKAEVGDRVVFSPQISALPSWGTQPFFFQGRSCSLLTTTNTQKFPTLPAVYFHFKTRTGVEVFWLGLPDICFPQETNISCKMTLTHHLTKNQGP